MIASGMSLNKGLGVNNCSKHLHDNTNTTWSQALEREGVLKISQLELPLGMYYKNA